MRMSSVASNSSGESSEEFSRKRSMTTANLSAEEIEPYVRRKRSNSASEKSVERIKKRAETLSEEEQNLLRTCINSRERRRMHDLNDALDDLRRVIPHSTENNSNIRKLSKITTVILATNWIRQLNSEIEQLRNQNEKFRKEAGLPTMTTVTGGGAAESCLGGRGEPTVTVTNGTTKLSQTQQHQLAAQPQLPPAFVGNPMIYQFPLTERLKSPSPRNTPKIRQNILPPQNAPMPMLAPLIAATNFQQSMAALNAAHFTHAFQRQLNAAKLNNEKNNYNSQAQLLNSQAQLRQIALAVGLINTVRSNNSPVHNSPTIPTVFDQFDEFPTPTANNPNLNSSTPSTVESNGGGESTMAVGGKRSNVDEPPEKTCRKCRNSLQNIFSSSSQSQSQSQSSCLCVECILSTKAANSNETKN